MKRPKILCLSSHSPVGPDYGARLRARHTFRLLNQIGDVRVALVGPFERSGFEEAGGDTFLKPVEVFEFQPHPVRGIRERLRRELDPRFLNTHGTGLSEKNRDALLSLVSEHDLVWAHGLRIANSTGIWRWPHSMLDIDDVPSALHRSALAREKGLKEKLRNWREAVLWRRREKVLSRRFDAMVVCSEADRLQFAESDGIFVVPNGFDAPLGTPKRMPASPPRIGFVGTLQYGPNADGLRWFVERVWPVLRKTMPETTLRIIGQGSDAADWRKHKNVEGLGFVPDADAEMATWSLTIVPLFVGGGTRVKIANAFSRRCPVVSTTLGAFGYDVIDGRELLLAELPEDFAAACLRLLQDKALAAQLEENAWNTFLDKWSWDAIAPKIASVAEFCLRQNASSVSKAGRSETAQPVSASVR